MFCSFCGAKLPDDAEFCSSCGKAVVRPESLQNHIEDNIITDEAGEAQENNVPEEASVNEEPPGQIAVMEKQNASGEIMERTGDGFPENTGRFDFAGRAGTKISDKPIIVISDKKKLKMIGIGVAVLLLVIIVGSTISSIGNTSKKIAQLEDDIYSLSASGFSDEDEVVRLYEEYDSLSDSNKRKVTNRESIINAYRQLEALIEQRKLAAGRVDNIIGVIDYSNMAAEASTVKEAVIAYNSLDDKEKNYVGLFEQLQTAYNEVKDMNIAVTAENFLDLFIVEFEVGAHTNYGGTTISQSGYTIDWDRYGGSVTPNYDVNVHNDYATPVHVYIAPRYQNLASECSFHINLHQTYKGIGLVDSDIHEFKRQSADIQFNSSQGVGDYLINVEDNDASSSLWNIFGLSYDWSDLVHTMNPFDVSRVEISTVSGTITY